MGNQHARARNGKKPHGRPGGNTKGNYKTGGSRKKAKKMVARKKKRGPKTVQGNSRSSGSWKPGYRF